MRNPNPNIIFRLICMELAVLRPASLYKRNLVFFCKVISSSARSVFITKSTLDSREAYTWGGWRQSCTVNSRKLLWNFRCNIFS